MSAAAHLVSARSNIIFADLDTPLMHADDPIVGGSVDELLSAKPAAQPIAA